MTTGDVEITITISPELLRGYSDEFLATSWHLAQANPAEIDDHAAGELAERIGREVIRRWLSSIEPQLWHHQGRHYYWSELAKLGRWEDGGRRFVPTAATPEADSEAGGS